MLDQSLRQLSLQLHRALLPLRGCEKRPALGDSWIHFCWLLAVNVRVRTTVWLSAQ